MSDQLFTLAGLKGMKVGQMHAVRIHYMIDVTGVDLNNKDAFAQALWNGLPEDAKVQPPSDEEKVATAVVKALADAGALPTARTAYKPAAAAEESREPREPRKDLVRVTHKGAALDELLDIAPDANTAKIWFEAGYTVEKAKSKAALLEEQAMAAIKFEELEEKDENLVAADVKFATDLGLDKDIAKRLVKEGASQTDVRNLAELLGKKAPAVQKEQKTRRSFNEILDTPLPVLLGLRKA